MSATTETPAAEGSIDQKNIQQIIQWEKEADSLTGEADAYRAQAAGLIVEELDRGVTERALAEAIGKSNSHVHFAAVAWRMIHDESQQIPDFNTAYKLAKRPKNPAPEPQANEAPPVINEGQQTTSEEDTPFPPWSQQMREYKRISAEMIEQANYKQIQELTKVMVRMQRAAVSKEEDLATMEPSK